LGGSGNGGGDLEKVVHDVAVETIVTARGYALRLDLPLFDPEADSRVVDECECRDLGCRVYRDFVGHVGEHDMSRIP
jgi:hypothetical protein